MIKERDSRFEMLRIVSMIMIILHHMALYTGMIDSKKLSVQAIGELILIGGKIGCFIFVILTGYFSTISIKSITMQGIKAWLAASFYGLTLAVIFKAMGEQIGIKEIIKGTLPISGGGYWFLTAYLGMLFCAPSVTYMIDVFNTEQLKTVGTLSIIVNILIPTVCVRINPFSNTVMLFCLYYAVGVLIRRKMIMTDVRKPFLKAMCIIIVVYFIQMVLCIWGRKYPAIYNSRNWLSGNNSLFIMIATVFIFVACTRMKKITNRTINTLAAPAFGVYLLHDNVWVRDLLWSQCFSMNFIEKQNSVSLFVELVGIAIVLYMICATIEVIREKLFNWLLFSHLNSSCLEYIYGRVKDRCTDYLGEGFGNRK